MITLNILPLSEKIKIKLKFLNKKALFFFIKILGMIILFIIILSLMLIFLRQELESEKKITAAKKADFHNQESEELKQSVISFNNKLSQINNILGANKNYAPVLKELAEIMPENVYLTSLSIKEISAPLKEKTSEETADKEKKLKGSKIQLVILGFSPLREKVLSVEENLRSSSFFSNIQSPLSNLVKQENIDFSFTFELTQN